MADARAQAQRRWLDYWNTTTAPAWASRDAFLAASAADPTVTVPVWLSHTERHAAWVAVEPRLPSRRVHYLVHRNWDEWWSIWRSVAPRLGMYPVAALVSWLTDSVNLGNPPAPRQYLQKAAEQAAAAGVDELEAEIANLPLPAAERTRTALGGPVGVVLLLCGALALFIGAVQARTPAAHDAGRFILIGFGFLVSGLGWVHSHSRVTRFEDPTVQPGAIRRLWPLFLAGLAWIPILRACSLLG